LKLEDMKDNRLGAVALILGAISGMITMSLHPTAGPHPITAAQFEKLRPLMVGVHALVIAGVPVSFLGALALTGRLNAPDRLSIAALVVYGFGLSAVTIAATMSGFVGTEIVREIVNRSPQSSQWHLLMDYNVRINQAFAAIFANACCAAIAVWSIAIVKDRRLSVGLGIYGLILGSVFIFAVGIGQLRLDVPGERLMIFSQALWFIIAAILLWRSKDSVAPV
jgi:hypothetical protein